MNPSKIIQFAAIVLFAAFSATAQIKQNGAESVIARGDGVLVKKFQLDEVIGAMQRALALHHKEISPDKLKALEIQTLKRLIQIQILINRATEADKAAGKTEAEQQIVGLIAKPQSNFLLMFHRDFS